MKIKKHLIEYKDAKSLSSELEFAIACDKVEGYEICRIRSSIDESSVKFINASVRILKTMKKDGVIQLYVLGSELGSEEKMESVYLLNKYPELAESDNSLESVYIKF